MVVLYEHFRGCCKSSNGPSGPRRECGVNSERSEELRRGGFADPEHLNLRRVEAALSRRNPKRNTSQQAGVSFWRCHPDLNWGVELLQSSALPLGYGTLLNTEQRVLCSVIGASDEARTRYLHLGKVALYQMSYTRILGPPRKNQRGMVPPVGIEPTTRGFSVLCSTN